MSKFANLPIINVRDVVMYPGMQVPLYIGREFTKKALLCAQSKHKGKLIVTTQREAENEDPQGRAHVFTVGTICKLLKSVKFSNGTMKVLVEAASPVKLRDLFEKDGVRFARVALVSGKKKDSATLPSRERAEVLELLIRWRPRIALNDESGRFELIKKEERRSRFMALALELMAGLEDKNSGPRKKKPSKSELLKTNRMVASRQKILEESNVGKQIQMMKETLKAEIATSCL